MKAGVKTYATWNPADKHANIILSNGNLTIDNTTGWAAVRANIGKSSGKWYWEVAFANTTYGRLPGVGNSTMSLAIPVGFDAYSWGFYDNSATPANKYHNSVAENYGAGLWNGKTVGIALDMDAGTIRFFLDNVDHGIAYSTGLTGTLFPAMSKDGTAGLSTANFGATALTYAPPAGFNAGVYN